MSDSDYWLRRFADNRLALPRWPLYWLASQLLLIGLIGLLWALPVPAELRAISPLINWGSLFLMAALIYYFIISVPLALGMLPVIIVIFALEFWLESLGRWTRPAVALLTLAGVTGLFAARHGHGGARAVFRDIQLLMISPLWLLSRVYRKLGIPS